MEIRAYGFSITPSKHVSNQDLIDEFEKLHSKRKMIDGKFRVFVFSSKADSKKFQRIGILSVRDEKVVIKLVEEDGEFELRPTLVEDEHVDFNMILLRVAKNGKLMGIATSYRGSASLGLIEKRIKTANHLALRRAIRELVSADKKETLNAKEYIEEHKLYEDFSFDRMMSNSNFEILVGKLDEIIHADLYFDVYQYDKDDPEKLLEKEIKVNHRHEQIRFQPSRHGRKLANLIKKMILVKKPRKANVTGKIQGYQDVVDLFENPDVLWHKDLDTVKKDLKIKLNEMTDNVLFEELSNKFATDPRF